MEFWEIACVYLHLLRSFDTLAGGFTLPAFFIDNPSRTVMRIHP